MKKTETCVDRVRWFAECIVYSQQFDATMHFVLLTIGCIFVLHLKPFQVGKNEIWILSGYQRLALDSYYYLHYQSATVALALWLQLWLHYSAHGSWGTTLTDMPAEKTATKTKNNANIISIQQQLPHQTLSKGQSHPSLTQTADRCTTRS